MKRKLYLVSLMAASLVLGSVCGVSSCGSNENNQVDENILSIFVSHKPTKLDYKEGESFDPTGMVVKARMVDETNVEVTDYVINKTGPLTIEDKKIEITYKGQSTTLNINVTALLKSDQITVKEAPTNLVYWERDFFDPEGVVLELEKVDGSKTDLTSFDYDLVNPLKTTDKEVTFTYNGLTCKQAIEVKSVSEYKPVLLSGEYTYIEAERADVSGVTKWAESGAEFVHKSETAHNKAYLDAVGDGDYGQIKLNFHANNMCTFMFGMSVAPSDGKDTTNLKSRFKCMLDGKKEVSTGFGEIEYSLEDGNIKWTEIANSVRYMEEGDHYITIEDDGSSSTQKAPLIDSFIIVVVTEGFVPSYNVRAKGTVKINSKTSLKVQYGEKIPADTVIEETVEPETVKSWTINGVTYPTIDALKEGFVMDDYAVEISANH